MKNIAIVLVFAIVLISCNREQSMEHEGVYLYEDIADSVCSFISVTDNAPILLKCSASKVKDLSKNTPVYISFSQTSKESKLKSISDPLSKVETQASWGEGCDFYFPLEDTWRELQCSDIQLTHLANLGKEPLLLVYYVAPDSKDKKDFYLSSAKSYKSEFTVRLRYTGEDSESPYVCSFQNPEDDDTLLLGCTKTQRAALDRYHKDTLLTVRYTDAGEYRLLSYETGDRAVLAAELPEAGTAPADVGEYFDDADDDYETTFQVHSTSGSFVAADSGEELCIFDVAGKKLHLACSKDDYTQLLAEPGRYEIYYTDEDVLFGYEKLY